MYYFLLKTFLTICSIMIGHLIIDFDIKYTRMDENYNRVINIFSWDDYMRHYFFYHIKIMLAILFIHSEFLLRGILIFCVIIITRCITEFIDSMTHRDIFNNIICFSCFIIIWFIVYMIEVITIEIIAHLE